jgi:hypothetical protein
VGYAEVTLLNGQIVEVEGDLSEVETLLSDAARSGHARFAWLTEHGTGDRVGVNPDQVLTLRDGEPASKG